MGNFEADLSVNLMQGEAAGVERVFERQTEQKGSAGKQGEQGAPPLQVQTERSSMVVPLSFSKDDLCPVSLEQTNPPNLFVTDLTEALSTQ